MKYYKDKNDQVYAYEADGSQDLYIKSDLILMTDAEINLHRNPPKSEEQLAQEAKALKVQQLDSITVTISTGKTFDGNEASRNNMLAAISAADYFNQTSATWKLSDNTVTLVTLEEIQEALALSIKRVGEIVTL